MFEFKHRGNGNDYNQEWSRFKYWNEFSQVPQILLLLVYRAIPKNRKKYIDDHFIITFIYLFIYLLILIIPFPITQLSLLKALLLLKSCKKYL